jgi:hypothetical protein
MDHNNSNLLTLPLGNLLLLLLAISILLIYPAIKIRKLAIIFVGGSLLFQSFHTLEHLVQLSRWFTSPYSPPYMSPIAKTASSQLESTFANLTNITGVSSLGMELLHLVGNGIFLTGGVVLYFSPVFAKVRKYSLYALLFEGVHMIEHSILTISALSGNGAWGASTQFNLLAGSQLSTHRIWWHGAMNLIALLTFALALTKYKFIIIKSTTLIFTLFLVNLLPFLVTHLFVDAPSGYNSTANLFTFNMTLALFFNPVIVLFYYLVYEKIVKKKNIAI